MIPLVLDGDMGDSCGPCKLHTTSTTDSNVDPKGRHGALPAGSVRVSLLGASPEWVGAQNNIKHGPAKAAALVESLQRATGYLVLDIHLKAYVWGPGMDLGTKKAMSFTFTVRSRLWLQGGCGSCKCC